MYSIEQQREWRKNNPDKVKAQQKRYKAKHKDRLKEYYEEWYSKNGRNRNAKQYEIVKKWRAENPEKVNAHYKVNKAIKSGKISVPNGCSKCSRENIRPHAHHPDYDKPLNIIWLCASCHKIEHNC